MIRPPTLMLSILLTSIVYQTAYAQTPIQIFYDERIPYALTDESGNVHGLTATPVAEAFQTANIQIEWKRMPFKRQLATIKANKKKACGIGWFKNPEREVFARFSDPLYQDRPTIIVTKKGNNIFERHSKIAKLLQDDSVKLLVKDGFSYGKYLDELIEQEQPTKLVVVGSSNLEMLKLILSERADYFFTAEEEAEEMINSTGFGKAQFELHRPIDMPAGNKRYLACSKQVTPVIIDQINQALGSSK